ncbi:MAG: hypothetical protein M3008_13980 [Chloroflexota bacterium]|nr:hypothetical protein [Chloroflexota bacterium]
MKVQLRRFVTIGLMSGSLAASIVAGSAAVGAATPNSALDSTVTSSAVLGNRSHEVRDIVTIAPVTTDLVVAITPANVIEPTTLVQVTNDDRLN